MRLGMLSLLLVAVSLPGHVSAAPTAPQPIVTKQSVFAIPFRVEQTNPARQPVEVQLCVSTDRGRHWQLYAKAAPTEKQFVFRAGGDGEYWFAVRTVDQSGKIRPETITAPGLCVRVEAGAKGIPATANRSAAKPTETASKRGPSLLQNPMAQSASDHQANHSTTTPEPRGSVAIAINPNVGRRYTGGGMLVMNETVNGPPPGERPRMVNSRKFELEYDVDSVGPSGIGRVELWGTRDGGKTWSSYAIDSDNRSPVVVSVDEEGTYGFSIVVTNGSGMGGKLPSNGDQPDLWVGVDFTKPAAQITSAQQGVGAEADSLIISWRADDRALAPRPVSLSFATESAGPWSPIVSGLENAGRYAWQIDSRTPSKFYLRLEVRDEAGNLGVHVTPELVTMDQSRPKVRLRDVRAINETSSRPIQWR